MAALDALRSLCGWVARLLLLLLVDVLRGIPFVFHMMLDAQHLLVDGLPKLLRLCRGFAHLFHLGLRI